MPDYGKNYESNIQHITWKTHHTSPMTILHLWYFFTNVSAKVLEQKRHELEKIRDSDWDLIVVDSYFTGLGMALAMSSKKQYTTFNPCSFSLMDSARVPESRPSYVASTFISEVDFNHNSFWKRLESVITGKFDITFEKCVCLSVITKFSHIFYNIIVTTIIFVIKPY